MEWVVSSLGLAEKLDVSVREFRKRDGVTQFQSMAQALPQMVNDGIYLSEVQYKIVEGLLWRLAEDKTDPSLSMLAVATYINTCRS